MDAAAPLDAGAGRQASGALRVVSLGVLDYHSAWQAMRGFTEWRRRPERRDAVDDELWLLEHPAVFTLGRAGDPSHCTAPGGIPLLRSDRGGQVTYHGPGQLVAYWLCDMRRRSLGVRDLVRGLEQAAIDVLAGYGIRARRRAGAPGVYVGEAKIAALGLRVCAGLSYHGLSINVNGDLEPFSRINPCGFAGLAVSSIAERRAAPVSVDAVGAALAECLAHGFGHGRLAWRPASQWPSAHGLSRAA